MDSEENLKGNIKITHPKNGESNETIPFSDYLQTSYLDEPNEKEDIVVYVVDNIPNEKSGS